MKPAFWCAVALLMLPTVASAECLSDGCYDGIVIYFVGGGLAIGLAAAALIMVFFKRTRRMALWVFLTALAVVGFVVWAIS